MTQITLTRAADYALAAYTWSRIDPNALMANKVTSFEDKLTDTEGFVGSDGDSTVVAFAGTEEIKDWMTNSRCEMVEVPLPGDYYVQVHRGFYEAYTSVGDQVQELIEQHSNGKAKKLIFVGHSLGGALAQLAALKCKIMDRPHKVITFGAPRVGSLCLASYMRKNVFRLEARGDLVPSLPAVWVPWRPRSVYVHAGKVIRRGYYIPGLCSPHSMTRYRVLAQQLQEELDILL
jgi:predicted lipase